MSGRSKIFGFMEKIFIIGTAYFLYRIIPVMPRELLHALEHCGAVILTFLVYALTLLTYLMSKM